jgi:hypothetical protein
MIKLHTEFEVGEVVFDDLTGESAKVIGISFARGLVNDQRLINNLDTIGYWLDNHYFSGARHPWELSKVVKKNKFINWVEKQIIWRRLKNGYPI